MVGPAVHGERSIFSEGRDLAIAAEGWRGEDESEASEQAACCITAPARHTKATREKPMTRLRSLIVLLLCAGCTLKDSLIDGGSEATLRAELAAQRARADSLQKQMTRFSRTADERDSALAIARATQDQLDEVDVAMSSLPGVTQRHLEIGKPAELADDPAVAEKIAEKISRARDLMRQSDEALERLRVSAAAARDSLHEEARRYDESIALMTTIPMAAKLPISHPLPLICHLRVESLSARTPTSAPHTSSPQTRSQSGTHSVNQTD